MSASTLPFECAIDVPASVAVCPYCRAPLVAQASQWKQEREGERWQVDQVDVDCTAMPDFEDDAWEGWWDAHRRMPYVYQLPVDMRIRAWMRGEVSP